MKDKKCICKIPFANLEVYQGGGAFNCCPLAIRGESSGNAYLEPVHEIMNSTFGQKLRAKILKNDYSLCDSKICTAKNNTNNLVNRYLKNKNISLQENIMHPLVVQFGQDKECNLKCVSCRHEIERNEDCVLKDLDNKIDTVFLPMLKKAEIAYLSNDGDPFASRHYRKLIKRIVEKYPKIKFMLHTNGILCTEKACQELGILDKIESVGVSIHAARKETYESIARGAKYEVLLKNLEWLSQMKEQGKINHISLFFVVSQMNYKEMPEFVELAKKYNANACFWVYHQWAGTDDVTYKKVAVFEPFHPEHKQFMKILKNPILKTNDTEFNPILDKLRKIKNINAYIVKEKIKSIAYRFSKVLFAGIDKALLFILILILYPYKKTMRKTRFILDNKPLYSLLFHPVRTAERIWTEYEIRGVITKIKVYSFVLKSILLDPLIVLNRKKIKNIICSAKPSEHKSKFIKIKNQRIDTIEYSLRELPKSIILNKSEKPLVSIVIPVYNQYKYTYACLYSIMKHTENIDYEVILADDCSTDKTKNINKFVENLKIVKTDKNSGFLKNCNNAIKQAKGQYICLVNNDTQVQPQWLDWMLKLFEQEQKVGVVGARMLYHSHIQQEAGTLIYKDTYFHGRMDVPTKSKYSYVKEVDYVPGCGLLTTKKLFDEVGGFDEIYAPAYYEDPDFCMEVKKRGYKVLYQPKATIVHYEGASYSKKREETIEHNKKIFDKKWEKELLEKTDLDEIKLPFTEKLRPKTILIIDDKLPEYDQHAGAKTIFHFLKLFKKMGMHIKFLPMDYILREPYATTLGQLGVEVLADYFLIDNDGFKKWLKENHPFVDYVLISRPHVAEQYLSIVKEYNNYKILYYGHDLHYFREMRNYELTKSPNALANSNLFKTLEYDIFKEVDMSYYPSQVEADIIKQELPDAKVKAVPAFLYDISDAPKQNSFDDKNDLMFVGGFGHSPNVDGILWFVKEVFPKIMEKNPDIKLHILGSKPTDEILDLQSDNINVLGYVEDDILMQYYLDCRIVVAPLRFGAGVKGKVVEAIYNQIPIVTTSIGAEGINQRDILTIADEPDDFANKLLEVYNNREKYEHIVHNSLNVIKENFSYEKAMEIFSQDIDSTFRENELIKEKKC